jgi:hypothetical protein
MLAIVLFPPLDKRIIPAERGPKEQLKAENGTRRTIVGLELGDRGNGCGKANGLEVDDIGALMDEAALAELDAIGEEATIASTDTTPAGTP